MTVEIAADKVVDLGLGRCVQVLEFVHGLEFFDIETIGNDTVRLSLQQMLRFVGGDVRDSGEYVGRVSGRSLNAVSVVDSSLAGLMIDVKVLEVVVEIDRARAKITTEEGSMSGEDSGDIDMSLSAYWNGHASLPLVEVSDDGLKTRSMSRLGIN